MGKIRRFVGEAALAAGMLAQTDAADAQQANRANPKVENSATPGKTSSAELDKQLEAVRKLWDSKPGSKESNDYFKLFDEISTVLKFYQPMMDEFKAAMDSNDEATFNKTLSKWGANTPSNAFVKLGEYKGKKQKEEEILTDQALLLRIMDKIGLIKPRRTASPL